MTTIRVKLSPEGLKKLKAVAKSNRRTVVAEAGLILESALSHPEHLTTLPVYIPSDAPSIGWPVPEGPTCGVAPDEGFTGKAP